VSLKLIRPIELQAALLAFEKLKVEMPSFVIFKISIGNEFLGTERARENLFTGVGPHVLQKTAMVLV
jgi:hypothetical protein